MAAFLAGLAGGFAETRAGQLKQAREEEHGRMMNRANVILEYMKSPMFDPSKATAAMELLDQTFSGSGFESKGGGGGGGKGKQQGMLSQIAGGLGQVLGKPQARQMNPLNMAGMLQTPEQAQERQRKTYLAQEQAKTEAEVARARTIGPVLQGQAQEAESTRQQTLDRLIAQAQRPRIVGTSEGPLQKVPGMTPEAATARYLGTTHVYKPPRETNSEEERDIALRAYAFKKGKSVAELLPTEVAEGIMEWARGKAAPPNDALTQLTHEIMASPEGQKLSEPQARTKAGQMLFEKQQTALSAAKQALLLGQGTLTEEGAYAIARKDFLTGKRSLSFSNRNVADQQKYAKAYEQVTQEFGDKGPMMTAQYQADEKSLVNLQRLYGSISSFETQLKYHTDRAAMFSKLVSRSDSRLLNNARFTFVQAFSSNPNLREYQNEMRQAAVEWARVTSSPSAAGALHVLDEVEAGKLVNASFPDKDVQAVMSNIMQAGQARVSTVSIELQQTRNRIMSSYGTSPVLEDMVPRAPTKGTQLDVVTSKFILDLAGGDNKRATALAIGAGWKP